MKTNRQNARQKKILELIENEPVSTQEALQKRLEQEGFPATQATLSRDIRALHLIKKGSARKRYYCQEQSTAAPMAGNVLKTDYAGNVVVIRCASGTAQAVCTWVDNMGYPEIVGTLAGDDTIFVLVRSSGTAKNFAQQLAEKLRIR